MLLQATLLLSAAHGGQPGWVSWWFDTHWSNSGNATAALAQLRVQGGASVASSLLLYCGDFVAAGGSIQVGTEVRQPTERR